MNSEVYKNCKFRQVFLNFQNLKHKTVNDGLAECRRTMEISIGIWEISVLYSERLDYCDLANNNRQISNH